MKYTDDFLKKIMQLSGNYRQKSCKLSKRWEALYNAA